MLNYKKIYIAGHNGMVGSAIINELKRSNYNGKIIFASRKELDLINQKKVDKFLQYNKPDAIIIAAAKVGGIQANHSYPAQFIYENLQIYTNLIHCAFLNQVRKVLFLGSSCIYPRNAKQPINEEQLLTGELEKTNEWYAVSKIAGIKLCQAYQRQYNCNFISVMPTNLYGERDNYHLDDAHVIPALMHKAYLAKINQEKELKIWGSGNPMREFLFVDDLAKGCLFLLDSYTGTEPINIGTGSEISIKNLAIKISDIAGFKGKLVFDKSKPDGTPRKILNINKIRNLGWKAEINLDEGLKLSYKWFVDNYKKIRK